MGHLELLNYSNNLLDRLLTRILKKPLNGSCHATDQFCVRGPKPLVAACFSKRSDWDDETDRLAQFRAHEHGIASSSSTARMFFSH